MPEDGSSLGIVQNSDWLEKRLLTEQLISRLASEANSLLVIADTGVNGLQLEVSEDGKTFLLLLDGTKQSIGSWPELSVDEAREEAVSRIRSSLKSRKHQEKSSSTNAAKPHPTLQQALTDYFAFRHLKAATAKDYQAVLNRYAADWLDREWCSITTEGFEARFAQVSAKSPAQANYFVRVVAAMWKFSIARYETDAKDPTARIKALRGLHRIKPKDTIIPDAIQPQWWTAVQTLGNPQLTAILIFLALTGCRRGEALRVQCDDFDWQARVVTFRETKNGTVHRLPLPDRLCSFLYQHCKGRRGPAFTMTMRALNAAAPTLSKQLGFRWALHDLRRTFVTVAQRNLKDLATVKRLVNHSTGGDVTMKHYLKLTVDDLREPMQEVEDAFARLAKGDPK